MKSYLIIDGQHTDTGESACLYRGEYRPNNEDDVIFQRYLFHHYQSQGWKTWFTIYFLIPEEDFDDSRRN